MNKPRSVSINSRINAAWRLSLAPLALALGLLLVSCGGGGAPAPVVCQPFVDSFGRSVTCAEMNALDGANLAYLDTGGDGGVGDGAGDGGAGDGAPIANATLRFTDINGKVVTTTTDATGYYRISLRGLKAPLVATVVRDAKPWKSMLVQDIVRAPANRNFYTINLTGLTDMVASEVAKKAGLSKTDDITPAAVASQKTQVPGIITAINNSISAQISAAGLDPNTFNPLSTPFHPVATDSYDKLSESVVVFRNAAGFTEVAPKYSYSVGGSITGLGSANGLVLSNGSETLPVPANQTTFTFVNPVAQGGTYSVGVQTQPAGASCSVTNGTGAIAFANVNAVTVTCNAVVASSFLPIPADGAFTAPAYNAIVGGFGFIDLVGANVKVDPGAITVQMTVFELPSTLVFNQPGVPLYRVEYQWEVFFDTDDDGIADYKMSMEHSVSSTTPSTQSVLAGTSGSVYGKQNSSGFSPYLVPAQTSVTGNTITLSVQKSANASLAAITSSSKVMFSTQYWQNGTTNYWDWIQGP